MFLQKTTILRQYQSCSILFQHTAYSTLFYISAENILYWSIWPPPTQRVNSNFTWVYLVTQRDIFPYVKGNGILMAFVLGS